MRYRIVNTKIEFLKKIFIYLFVVLVCFIILIPSILFFEKHTQAETCFREAKNIQLAMKLLAIKYYGDDKNVYISNTQFGMVEDTINEIIALSGATGEITLVSWNNKEGIPGKFYYQTEKFLVIYEYDVVSREPTWNIYNTKQIMELGK